MRQNRYVIIMLKTTSNIAIWSYVFLHTQNNIFYIELKNRNKHLPGWSLLQSVWMNLHNYILQQNILASGKLFTKICSRAHENKWSWSLPLQNLFCYLRISAFSTDSLLKSLLSFYISHGLTVWRVMTKKQLYFLLTEAASALIELYEAFCAGSWQTLKEHF